MIPRLLSIGICLSTVFCQGQTRSDIVILKVKNDRSELADVVEFLNANSPRLICLNVDLSRCEQEKSYDLFPNGENHFDSLSVRSVTHPSEGEKKLSRQLDAARVLLMQSTLRPFGPDGYSEITGCAFLYSEETSTGFVDLVSNNDFSNQIEKFQVSHKDPFGDTSYHFAVKIALVLNEEKALAFTRSHGDTVRIDFSKERKFAVYNFDDFGKKKTRGKQLKGKIVIVSIGQPEDYFLVRKKTNGLSRMSTSEIFANIACQIIGE